MKHRELWQGILFNADDKALGSGTGDSGVGDNNVEVTPATGTSPVNDGNEAGGTTFTQEQVDSMIANRVKREREAFLKESGFDSIESLKALQEERKQAEEAQKTEAQKLADALKTEQEQRLGLETQLAEMKQARLNDKRDSAIKRLAQSAQAVDLEDVVLNINKNAEALAKFVNEDGVVDETAIQASIAELRTAKPHLFGKQIPSSPSHRGGNAPNPDKKTLEQAKNDYKRRARG